MEKIVAVDRALDMLLLLYESQEEMGISEISRELDLAKSTVHRTLTTMKDKGFVCKNDTTEKYFLGMKIYAMGLLLSEKTDLVDIIAPYANRLHEEVGEVINVSILDESPGEFYKTLVVYKSDEKNNVLSVNPSVGSVSDAHTSSVGKSLLAFTDGIDLFAFGDEVLKKHTDNTIVTIKDLDAELKRVRQDGYAVDREEQEIGLYCVGAPVLDRNNQAVAAISISGPTARMKSMDLDGIIENLKKTTREIEMIIRQIK